MAEHVGRSYRPDIDGLRAVAVLSVVLYHINKSLIPGGYVGVDVFFVISGYLITRNIWSEVRQGSFSILNFYVRRVHRIYPAFAVVTLATLVAGALLLLPTDMVRLARSAFWSAFSLPNVYFWKYLDTAYFAAASEEEPLLHMWSLGVEEQFYFIWPCLLLASFLIGRKRSGAAIGIAVIVAVLSFTYAQAFLSAAPKFTYYMLPARAGELMMGALLALLPVAGNEHGGSKFGKGLNETLSVAGVLLIAGSLALLNDNSRFPGFNAIWPCLGTVLLIRAGQGPASSVSRSVLSLRPLVFVGLISYSLYLWHWPILSFIRYFTGQVSAVAGAVAFVVMLVLAWLSYRFVETPLRHWRPRRATSFGALWVAPLSVMALLAYGLLVTDGLRQQVARQGGRASLAMAVAPAYSFKYVCQTSVTDPNVLDDPRCLAGAATKQEPRVLLWGDSKAAQYIGFLDEVGKQQGFSFRNAEHSSCPPIFVDNRGSGTYRESCNRFWKLMQAEISTRKFDVIFIGASWGYYGGNDAFQNEFRDTLDRVLSSGAKVVLLSDVPRYIGYNRACPERTSRLPVALDCEPMDGAIKADLYPAEQFLSMLAAQSAGQIQFVDFKKLVCPRGRCRASIGGAPLYFDEGHISLQGGRMLAKELLDSQDPPVLFSAVGNNDHTRHLSQ
ncbi:acyltransferase family protein [Lysobacter olei]